MNITSDAVRLAIVAHIALGQDLLMSEDNMEISRNIVNKLWNIGKYIDRSIVKYGDSLNSRNQLSQLCDGSRVGGIKSLPLSERYILSRLNRTVGTYNTAIKAYDFQTAVNAVIEFTRDDLADWFIEVTKTRDDAGGGSSADSLAVLYYVWEQVLRLLHPSMPFVTEVLWQQLPRAAPQNTNRSCETIMLPDDATAGLYESLSLFDDESAIANFTTLQKIVREIRNIRLEYKVAGTKRVSAIIELSKSGNAAATLMSDLKCEKQVLALLAKVDTSKLIISDMSQKLVIVNGDSMGTLDTIIEDGVSMTLMKADLVCGPEVLSSGNNTTSIADSSKELARLQKQLKDLDKDAEVFRKRLSSEGYLKKAAPAIIARDKLSLEDVERQIAQIKTIIESL